MVGRRVERLGPDARTALSAAAVIGREFDLDLLLAVVEFPEDRLLDLLDEAVAASLLQESVERAGRFAFAHGLVEHALYEDLGRARRARMHKRVAQALEELCGGEPGERLGELAGHWAAAVVSADTAKAIHYARRAAERALDQLAPDEAERWYRQALELHDQAPRGDRSERCDLMIGLGEAQRQAGNPEFRQTLLDAAALAQELDDVDRLARAVLANTRGLTSRLGEVDSERVQSKKPQHLRSRTTIRSARRFLRCWPESSTMPGALRCRQLAAEAIEIARAAGDEAALAHTLAYVSWAITAPDTLAQRRLLVGELFDLTQHLNDPRLRRFAGYLALWRPAS